MTQQQSEAIASVGQVEARFVEERDLVLIEGVPIKVNSIEVFDLSYHMAEKPVITSSPEYDHRWTVLKFSGSLNFVRFPHEKLTVVRATVR
jgi:hypothetical protein